MQSKSKSEIMYYEVYVYQFGADSSSCFSFRV